jgi:FkbM family methyltransferase
MNIIIIILIILVVILIINQNKFELFISADIDNNKYYNEKGKLINHKVEERTEQEQAFKYIEPNDIVLELGGRYGTVSAIINYKLNNKKNHVVVEPDENIIPSLTKNRNLNNSDYHILPKIISNTNKKKIDAGYGTHYVDVDNNNDNKTNNIISYQDFKKQYPLNFNVIVADCEGCLAEFIKNMGDDFSKINKIIFEADFPNLCNYDQLIQNLINNGFTMIEEDSKFRYVFMKI